MKRATRFQSAWARAFVLLACISTLTFQQTSYAATVHRLKPVANAFKFQELLNQKVVTVDLVKSIASPDLFTISATLALSASTAQSVTANSDFSLTAGQLSFHHKIGDDPAYKAGKTTAAFADFYTVTVKGKIKKIVYRTTHLHWTATALTVSVTAHTSDTATPGWSSILANIYPGASNGALSNQISGSVTFAGAALIFDPVAASGKISNKLVKEHGGTTFTIAKVSLKGAGATTHPAFAAVFATSGSATALTGTAASNLSGGTLTITSGPLAGITVTIPPGAVPGSTQFTLSSNNLSLTPNSGTFSGEGLEIDTDGITTFQQPLDITVPFPDDGSIVPVPYYVNSTGQLELCQLVSIDHTAHTFTFETFHASAYTWIYSLISGTNPHTTYQPGTDGFQIVNLGSVYNPGGECFGMTAFEQWYFRNHNGGLYPRYWQDIPVPAGGTVKGQNIIATRAHTSVSRYWTTYLPRITAEQNFTMAEELSVIENAIDNTAAPTILYLSGTAANAGAHAILAYNYDGSNLYVNDPNLPGQSVAIAGDNLTYPPYGFINLIGDGSLRKEAFDNIYTDAEAGFNGNGAAQVNVTSHFDYEQVTDQSVTFQGFVSSGQVLVDDIEIWVNDSTVFERQIGLDGGFSVTLPLLAGTNNITFKTKGHDDNGNVINAPNTQLTPFHLICTAPDAVILTTPLLGHQ